MRVFSNFDKAFINKILALEAADEKILFAHEFFKDLIGAESQVYITGRDTGYILQEGEQHYHKIEISGNADNIAEDYFKYTGAFYQANDLFNYLTENGFLIRHEGAPALGLFFNMLPDSERASAEKIVLKLDKLLLQFLDNLTYFYRPTEALRDLAKNKFRTKDERNNRTTRGIAITSIVITLLGLLLNYYINKGKNELPKVQTIALDSNNIKYFLNQSKSQYINLDTNSLNFVIDKINAKLKVTRDTLKTKPKNAKTG